MITNPLLLNSVINWRLEIEKNDPIGYITENTRKERNFVTNWDKHYLGFNSITQRELDLVCKHANEWFKALDLPYYVGNSMGEIYPGTAPQRDMFESNRSSRNETM